MPRRHLHWMAVGEFAGSVPDIPIAPGIDYEALVAGDDDPFFVSLRVAEEGAVSKTGLVYDEALVDTLGQQIISKTGLRGHITDEERGYSYPVPAGIWVGVQKVGKALWAKAYILPGETRDFFRRLKAVGGEIATSIYGSMAEELSLGGGRWKASGFKLESLDFAPPERAALQLGGQWLATAQMTDKSQEGPTMDPITLQDVPDSVREQIVTQAIEEFKRGSAHEQKVVELTARAEQAENQVKQLNDRLAQTERQEFDAKLDAAIAESVKVEALRPVVRRAVMSQIDADVDADSYDAASKALAAYLASDEYKALAEPLVKQISGGRAIVAPHPTGGGTDASGLDRDRIAEQAVERARQRGLITANGRGGFNG